MEQMPERQTNVLRPGDRAPNIVLDVINRQGRIAIDDFRGQKPLLIGLFRGLHCPFCRRHLAAQAPIDKALREKGVECLAVVNTPIDRARLYFQYHPMPDLLAASDPDRASHRAFGLRNLDMADVAKPWQRKVGHVASMLVNSWDGYRMDDLDQQMEREGTGQLFGQFLLDRDGIIRWSFTEAPEEGRPIFARPTPDELLSAASQLAN
jgi:peroxiredoxin